MSLRRLAAVLALSSTPALADNFVAVDLFGTPNNDLYTWNSSDPQGSLQDQFQLATGFVRALRMLSPTEGYYISCFSDQGKPTGFYHLENGISTKIVELPFKTPSWYGLELDASGGFLLTLVDRDWADDNKPYQIYRVDFDGTFTPITDVTLQGDSSIEFRGFARNPSTGEYFAAEMNFPPQDRLCKINPQTGEVTVVGHIGVNSQSNGGLAFSADGQHLYYAIGFGHLYELDQQTGAPTELANWPINTNALSIVPPAACYADFTGDGVLDIFDFLAYMNAFNAADPVADCTGDGASDLFDFLCFTNAFNGGC